MTANTAVLEINGRFCVFLHPHSIDTGFVGTPSTYDWLVVRAACQFLLRGVHGCVQLCACSQRISRQEPLFNSVTVSCSSRISTQCCVDTLQSSTFILVVYLLTCLEDFNSLKLLLISLPILPQESSYVSQGLIFAVYLVELTKVSGKSRLTWGTCRNCHCFGAPLISSEAIFLQLITLAIFLQLRISPRKSQNLF